MYDGRITRPVPTKISTIMAEHPAMMFLQFKFTYNILNIVLYFVL